jgi:hypothetical protein
MDTCKTVYVYQDSKQKVLRTMVDHGLIASVWGDVKCLDVRPETYNPRTFNTIELEQ